MILFFASNRDLQRYFSQIVKVCNTPAKVHWCRALILPALSAIKLMPKTILAQEIAYAVQSFEYVHKRKVGIFFRLQLTIKGYFFFCRDYAVFKKEQPRLLVMWNGMMFRRSLTVAAAKALNIQLCFMENGHFPNTTVCDKKGVNAGNSLSRDAEFYRFYTPKNFIAPTLVAREAIIEKKSAGKVLPEHFIFIPFQVDTDSQILVYSDWINNMQQLFELMLKVQTQVPQLKLVFKEHPSSRVNYAYLHQHLPEKIGVFANDYSTQALIQQSQAVVTINSTVGLEALIFNKKVITLGEAFFNIKGMSWHATNEHNLVDLLLQLDNLSIDDEVCLGFLSYLSNEYLLAESWKKASVDHLSAVATRVQEV